MDRIISSKRWNPILGEWVIIAETTADRPWSGNEISRNDTAVPDFDPSCYLCPGVVRAGGAKNPEYKQTFVFDNDFPSLSKSVSGLLSEGDIPANGICRVVCFSPRHDLSLAEMGPEQIGDVLQTFQDQYLELAALPDIEYVLPFENKGTVIGVSNPHPHGQIYATDFVPRIPEREYSLFEKHMHEKSHCLLCDIIEKEKEQGIRVICRNEDFIAFVPFFARHSFEIHLIPFRHVPSLGALTKSELVSMAEIYHEVAVRYDNLFEISFPNITVFHSVPCGDGKNPEPFHFHVEFCPPMRSADKLKYMAGFETGSGNIINPMLPERAAEMLRNVSPVHYNRR